MKKFAAGLSILLLSSCLQAGDYSILPQRNSFFEAWDSYPIDYYDTDLQLVKSEYITEREFEPNKILSAYVGYSVADLKTYRKDFFKAEYVSGHGRRAEQCVYTGCLYQERKASGYRRSDH